MAEPTPRRPPNGVVRVALQGTIGDGRWVNRFWLQVTPSGSPGATELLALSNAVSAAYRARFLSLLANSVTLSTQRSVWFKDADTEVAVDGSDTGSGTDATSSTIAECCYLLNWQISGSYRGGHPRTYLPGAVPTKFSTTTHLTTTHRNNLSTAAANFLSDVNALAPTGFSAVKLGTIRFFRGHAALDPPVFEPFLAGSCSPIGASQRRRMGR